MTAFINNNKIKPEQMLGIGFFLVSLCITFAFLLLGLDLILFIAGIATISLVSIAVVRPEFATYLVIFLIYTNIPVIAYKYHGVPQVLAGAVSLFIALPFAVYIFVRRQQIVIDYPCLLMILFLGSVLASTLFAQDLDLAYEWILTYILEGLALYFLIINVVRNMETLKKAIWMVLFAGALLGCLSLYQELTLSYKTTFLGLAQRSKDLESEEDLYSNTQVNEGVFHGRDEVKGINRSAGPIGDPNRYAQILLVLIPLGLFRFWGERAAKRKMLAIFSVIFILCGVLLTYSRGAFVTLVLIIFCLTVLRHIRLRQVFVVLAILIVLILVASPGYLTRISSLRGVEGLFSETTTHTPDAVTRGRTTEMLAALMAFLDYPLLGVGPAQYTPFYSMEYQLDPEIALRHLPKTRRAHILYFELAAETGIFGFCIFMSIVLLILYRLWRWRQIGKNINPEISNMATAFLLSLIGYLGTAIFLHLSYQRYYWLLLALAGAAIQIFHREAEEQTALKEDQLEITDIVESPMSEIEK